MEFLVLQPAIQVFQTNKHRARRQYGGKIPFRVDETHISMIVKYLEYSILYRCCFHFTYLYVYQLFERDLCSIGQNKEAKLNHLKKKHFRF